MLLNKQSIAKKPFFILIGVHNISNYAPLKSVCLIALKPYNRKILHAQTSVNVKGSASVTVTLTLGSGWKVCDRSTYELANLNTFNLTYAI